MYVCVLNSIPLINESFNYAFIMKVVWYNFKSVIVILPAMFILFTIILTILDLLHFHMKYIIFPYYPENPNSTPSLRFAPYLI